MIFSDSERDRRWALVRALLDELDVDAIIARATPASDGQGDYRWLSLYSPLSSDGAVVFTRDDQALIATDWPQAMYSGKISWFSDPIIAPGVAGGLADWLAARGAKRVGVAGLPLLPRSWESALMDRIPSVALIDATTELMGARTAKSSEELAIIERCAQLADSTWDLAHDLTWRGRFEYEVLADLDHHLRSEGCDGNFNLILHVGRDVAFDRQPASRRFTDGDAFELEISPRLSGYFTQLTSVVSIGEPSQELADAFQVGVDARHAVASGLRPGRDAQVLSAAITEHVAERGHRVAGPGFGHFLGMELEEPRLTGAPYQFIEDSVLVFHPVVSTQSYPVVLRGDTFRVGAEGLIPLNRLPERISVL